MKARKSKLFKKFFNNSKNGRKLIKELLKNNDKESIKTGFGNFNKK